MKTNKFLLPRNRRRKNIFSHSRISPNKIPVFRILLFPLGLGILWGLWGFVPAPGEKHKGTLYTDAMLTQMEENKTLCRPDSGTGYLMYLTQEVENPLFESAEPNQVHFYLAFAEPPAIGQRIHLPAEGVQLCYYEKGDLLMFKTFQPQGWIRFDQAFSEKTVCGEMDLKLVKPHHNMSNGDYHYMGGNFKLKSRKFESVE